MNLLLVPVVALAFAVEATLGFGATLVAVSLGALWMDVKLLLPAFVPLNMILSAWIVVLDRALVDRRTLLVQVLPAMAIGMPIGLFAFRALDADLLRRGLGAVVIVLAVRELLALGGAVGGRVRGAALVAAGAVHGALGTGGPLVVWALGSHADKPRALRATLASLWFALNLVLVAGFALDGRLDAATARASGLCAVGLVIGAAVGEVLHRRIDARRFSRLVWGALMVVGAALLLR